MTAKRYPENPISVNLDSLEGAGGGRRTIILAACVALANQRRTGEISRFREQAGELDLPGLLGAAAQLGVEFYTGGKLFLPQELTHR